MLCYLLKMLLLPLNYFVNHLKHSIKWILFKTDTIFDKRFKCTHLNIIKIVCFSTQARKDTGLTNSI